MSGTEPKASATTADSRQPMLLYLMRHALAEPPAVGQQDRTRRLTPEGLHIAERAARAFASGGLSPDRLFSSPYLRARQTADVVSTVLGVAVEEDRRIAPGLTLEALEELHLEAGRAERMMVVGHEPDMGRTVYALTGCALSVREAMLMVVEVASPGSSRGTLRGVYDPGVMASIGSALEPS